MNKGLVGFLGGVLLTGAVSTAILAPKLYQSNQAVSLSNKEEVSSDSQPITSPAASQKRINVNANEYLSKVNNEIREMASKGYERRFTYSIGDEFGFINTTGNRLGSVIEAVGNHSQREGNERTDTLETIFCGIEDKLFFSYIFSPDETFQAGWYTEDRDKTNLYLAIPPGAKISRHLQTVNRSLSGNSTDILFGIPEGPLGPIFKRANENLLDRGPFYDDDEKALMTSSYVPEILSAKGRKKIPKELESICPTNYSIIQVPIQLVEEGNHSPHIARNFSFSFQDIKKRPIFLGTNIAFTRPFGSNARQQFCSPLFIYKISPTLTTEPEKIKEKREISKKKRDTGDISKAERRRIEIEKAEKEMLRRRENRSADSDVIIRDKSEIKLK